MNIQNIIDLLFFYQKIQAQRMHYQEIITMPFVAFQTTQDSFTKNMFNQQNRQSVLHFVSKIKTASHKKQKKSPFIKLSVLFVPSWEIQGNSYENQSYLKTKQKFFQQVVQFYQQQIYIQDFYLQSNLVKKQKKFFHHLGSLKYGFGNCIDIIKICKIIQNKGNKHLCLDLNTKIINVEQLYDITFSNPTQQDLLNACYYDQHYISAHNKIAYCPENSSLAQKIKQKFDDFIEINANNIEIKYKNCIYSKVFAEATHQLLYTKKVIINNKVYFFAQLKNQVFSMTKLILSAIHRSWDPQNDKKINSAWSNLFLKLSQAIYNLKKFEIDYHENVALKKIHVKFYNKIFKQIEGIKFWYEDALIDIKVLEYIAKKHSNKLQAKTIQQLKLISDQESERIIVNKFIQKIQNLISNREQKQNQQRNLQILRYISFFQQQKFNLNLQYFQTMQKTIIQLQPLQQYLKN